MDRKDCSNRLIYESKDWFACLDRNPINSGHTLLFYEPSPTLTVPTDFESTLRLLIDGLTALFNEGIPNGSDFTALADAFPHATGKLVRVLFYRLGDAESSFHAHLVPYFEGDRKAAQELLRGRTAGKLQHGGLLYFLGHLENNKDRHEALGQADRTAELGLEALARKIRGMIPNSHD